LSSKIIFEIILTSFDECDRILNVAEKVTAKFKVHFNKSNH